MENALVITAQMTTVLSTTDLTTIVLVKTVLATIAHLKIVLLLCVQVWSWQQDSLGCRGSSCVAMLLLLVVMVMWTENVPA